MQKEFEGRQKKEEFYLELWASCSSLRVAQEGDEGGSEGVVRIVVLGAFAVGQLDQAVVIGQVGVRLTQTPGAESRSRWELIL